MASATEWQCVLTALGDLKDHRVVREYVHDRGRYVDWDGLYNDNAWNLFTIGERQLIHLAELLYREHCELFSLIVGMQTWTSRQWIQALEAMTIKKGIDNDEGLHILPGNWMERIG